MIGQLFTRSMYDKCSVAFDSAMRLGLLLMVYYYFHHFLIFVNILPELKYFQ